MKQYLHKFFFLTELFINGLYILAYSVLKLDELPSWLDKDLAITITDWGRYFVPFVLIGMMISKFQSSDSVDSFIRRHIFSVIVVIPLIITLGDKEFAFWLSSAHLLSSILALYDEDRPNKKRALNSDQVFRTLKLKPAQLVLLSFSVVILTGTFLLMLPVSTLENKSLSFVDAIFMATSATCVTGLTTVSLTEQFTMFGQVVILILIQIGGLSIMTLVSSMTILLGRSMGMKDRIIMQDLLDVSSMEELLDMIMDIVKYTFFLELWGGIILTLAFIFDGFEFGKAIYYGFFHSISAFCNAGFSLFENSLESYATNPLVNLTICTLVILGGIGFIVLKELRDILVQKRSIARISIHTKTVLVTSFILTVSGALMVFYGEFLHSLDGYSLFDKTQIAIFQSVTLRTAGFNTIAIDNLNIYTIYGMTLFMFIGGSPGSTAGGVKTTTLAILVRSIVSTLKGRKEVSLFGREIASALVVRTIAITFISLIILSSFVFILVKLEPEQSFLTLMFEAISASGTVGLTLGVTPFLSAAGKFALSALMLIGRIGPLTLILAIGQQTRSSGNFDYPEGKIMIG